MQLNLASLNELHSVQLPSFDVSKVMEQGRNYPRWIHIGPGNLFRVHIARLAQELIEAGYDWPIVAVRIGDPIATDIQLLRHDLLTLGVTLHPDGSQTRQVIAGISQCLALAREKERQRVAELIVQPQLSLMSFTITEKGYVVSQSSKLIIEVAEAIETGPSLEHRHTMAVVATLLWLRYQAGKAPITLLSFDNFSHNGDQLATAVRTIAQGWLDRGFVEKDFLTWLDDRSQVGFPITVIDKITPRPHPRIAAQLADDGFTDMGIQQPAHTPLAGFVNTEAPEYLVIEDSFAGPRPPLEQVGVHLVERQVCDDFEQMKVTACLNPLHTALAIGGCLLRLPTIDAAIAHPSLRRLVEVLGWDEAMPVVADPGIVAPGDFLQEVLKVRFPNPYLPDDPARIAMDTSQKMPIRFGATLRKYVTTGRDLSQLRAIPLIVAMWCRYLVGIADDGTEMVLSPDPLLGQLTALMRDVTLGEKCSAAAELAPLLSRSEIFGIDLYSIGLGNRVEELFARMLAGPGAVAATLEEELR